MKKIKLLSPILAGTIVTSSLIGIVACNKTYTTDQIVNQLVETTKNEFKNVAKVPRKSYNLSKIQSYLNTWITNHGWVPSMDKAGNIYFDVNATTGRENEKKAVLQAHMDMVFAYDKTQASPIGKKDVPDPRTYELKIVEEEVNGRKVFHTEDYFTSLGADDTIGIAMIMAIITNPNVSHGPLRVLFTTDEEEGLIGAQGMDASVLNNCDYLINFDGEGRAGAENIICTGCQGYCEYEYKNLYTNAPGDPCGTLYQIKISGLKGGHCMDEDWIKYQHDGIANVGANADKMLVMILDAMRVPSGGNAQIQLKSVKHYDRITQEEISFEAKKLPDNVTAQFYSNITEDQIKTYVTNTINQAFKTAHPYEDWDNSVKIEVQTINNNDNSKHDHLSASDTGTLLQYFNKTIKCDILEWEGSSEEEKQKNNYPLKTSNFSSFSVQNVDDNTMQFTCKSRGCAGTNVAAVDLRKNLLNDYKAVWPNAEIVTKKDSYPWDTTVYHSLTDFTKAKFESFGVTPVCEKTRGGVEPAIFSSKKPGIEQVVIGPRIDDIHSPKETLYIDTIFNVMKTAILVLQDLNNINK